jgi:ABC-type phosphate transport system substrate-binding protein
MKQSCPAVAGVLAAVLLSALLSGCGGGAGAGTAAPAPAPETPSSPSVQSPGASFTATLVSLVQSAPESAEAADVEGVMPSTPDGDEPVTVE